MVVFLEVPRHECSILHIPAKLCCNNLGRLGFFTETFAIVEWLFKVFARVDSNMWPMDLGFPALVFFFMFVACLCCSGCRVCKLWGLTFLFGLYVYINLV